MQDLEIDDCRVWNHKKRSLVMNVNDDIGKKVIVHPRNKQWTKEHSGMCETLYLDLVDKIKPVATKLVRISPSSFLPPDLNGGGKEVFVLEGTFNDQRGAYPFGSYMRFPPGTKHQPFTESGCLLFVKTWQFAPTDRKWVNVDASEIEMKRPRNRPGVVMQHLFGDNREDVRIEHWESNHHLDVHQCNGLEVLVLSGEFFEPSTSYKPYSWVRLPPAQPLKVVVGDKGARVLIKESHLVHAVPGRQAFGQTG